MKKKTAKKTSKRKAIHSVDYLNDLVDAHDAVVEAAKGWAKAEDNDDPRIMDLADAVDRLLRLEKK